MDIFANVALESAVRNCVPSRVVYSSKGQCSSSLLGSHFHRNFEVLQKALTSCSNNLQISSVKCHARVKEKQLSTYP